MGIGLSKNVAAVCLITGKGLSAAGSEVYMLLVKWEREPLWDVFEGAFKAKTPQVFIYGVGSCLCRCTHTHTRAHTRIRAHTHKHSVCMWKRAKERGLNIDMGSYWREPCEGKDPSLIRFLKKHLHTIWHVTWHVLFAVSALHMCCSPCFCVYGNGRSYHGPLSHFFMSVRSISQSARRNGMDRRSNSDSTRYAGDKTRSLWQRCDGAAPYSLLPPPNIRGELSVEIHITEGRRRWPIHSERERETLHPYRLQQDGETVCTQGRKL